MVHPEPLICGAWSQQAHNVKTTLIQYCRWLNIELKLFQHCVPAGIKLHILRVLDALCTFTPIFTGRQLLWLSVCCDDSLSEQHRPSWGGFLCNQKVLTLCMLGNFACFFYRLWIFFLNLLFPLRKHAYPNILNILQPKNENFQIKKSDIFHISAQNIACGYLLEPPRQNGSNEYPQSMFLSKNRKNNVYPCKPQFYYIKVGFKGVKII